MKINRILPHFFTTTDVCDEEITQKHEKSFEEILLEEQEKLMRLISEAENTENMEQFYRPLNPRLVDDLFFEEWFVTKLHSIHLPSFVINHLN